MWISMKAKHILMREICMYTEMILLVCTYYSDANSNFKCNRVMLAPIIMRWNKLLSLAHVQSRSSLYMPHFFFLSSFAYSPAWENKPRLLMYIHSFFRSFLHFYLFFVIFPIFFEFLNLFLKIILGTINVRTNTYAHNYYYFLSYKSCGIISLTMDNNWLRSA